MSIFSVFQLLGGLAFFLFGMTLMSGSLEKMTGGKLEKMLRAATSNPVKALIFGALITIAIQSSSAVTVMLVGFVNSGIMELGQTIGVIMGSNIGTTLTAWILSLAGISSDNLLLSMLKPENFSPVVALVGVIMIMTARKQRKKDIGTMLVGFAILMTGMNFMSSSMEPLADMPEFTSMLTAFTNPVIGVLVGAVITGVIQSSAASVGILQALSMTGQITYGMSIPIIMGQNIGTCVTAIISSIGVGRAAKRVSVVHISFNIIGTLFWLTVFYGLQFFLPFPFMGMKINPVGIAMVHTVFNIATTLLLLPFARQLEKLSRLIIPDSKEDQETFLDERLMATPAIALEELGNRMKDMADKTQDGLNQALELLLGRFEEKRYAYVVENEDKIDKLQDHIGAYVMKLSTTQPLSEEGKRKANAILQAVNEFERLADYAHYLANSANEMDEKSIVFSPQAQREEKKLLEAVRECYLSAVRCYEDGNVDLARKVTSLGNVVEMICSHEKESHVKRMNAGICNAEKGYIFNDILNSCSRIAGHSMNIAVLVVRVREKDLGSAYMHDLKLSFIDQFREEYREYYEKYMPESLKA